MGLPGGGSSPFPLSTGDFFLGIGSSMCVHCCVEFFLALINVSSLCTWLLQHSVCSRFVERFDACYNLLTRCQQRDIVVEQRISLALAMSLVQRHLVRFQARQQVWLHLCVLLPFLSSQGHATSILFQIGARGCMWRLCVASCRLTHSPCLALGPVWLVVYPPAQAGSDSEVPSWLLLSRNPSPTGDSLLEFQDAASEDLRRAQEVLERGIERSKSLSVKLHISLLAVVQKMRNQEPAPKPAADAWHKIIFRLQCLEMEQTVDVQTRHRYFAEALQALRTAPHLELGSRLAVQVVLRLLFFFPT